jgi:predicted RNase H-like nuclease (RuvC/YqgF family)
MAEIRPSVEIKKDILLKESQITSANKTLETLRRPFVTLSSLQKQMDELKRRIEEEKDDRIVARLKRQLESLSSQYDNIKKSITRELEQKVKEAEISIEKLNSELESLKKELAESLKYEESLKIRASKTVVRLTNISQILGGADTISLTVNQGQRLEYLRSVDSGNVYMKLSKLGTAEEFVGTIKSIDYKSIFVQEDIFVGDVPQPESPIKVFPKSDSGISNGGETMYFTQVMDFQTTIRLSLGLGFVAFDVDRQDGDLSIWVLLSGGAKAVN